MNSCGGHVNLSGVVFKLDFSMLSAPYIELICSSRSPIVLPSCSLLPLCICDTVCRPTVVLRYSVWSWSIHVLYFTTEVIRRQTWRFGLFHLMWKLERGASLESILSLDCLWYLIYVTQLHGIIGKYCAYRLFLRYSGVARGQWEQLPPAENPELHRIDLERLKLTLSSKTVTNYIARHKTQRSPRPPIAQFQNSH